MFRWKENRGRKYKLFFLKAWQWRKGQKEKCHEYAMCSRIRGEGKDINWKNKGTNYFKIIWSFNISHITDIKYIFRTSIFKLFDTSITMDKLLNLSLKIYIK